MILIPNSTPLLIWGHLLRHPTAILELNPLSGAKSHQGHVLPAMACFLAASLQVGDITPAPATPTGGTIHLIQAGRREGFWEGGPRAPPPISSPRTSLASGAKGDMLDRGGLVRVCGKRDGENGGERKMGEMEVGVLCLR